MWPHLPVVRFCNLTTNKMWSTAKTSLLSLVFRVISIRHSHVTEIRTVSFTLKKSLKIHVVLLFPSQLFSMSCSQQVIEGRSVIENSWFDSFLPRGVYSGWGIVVTVLVRTSVRPYVRPYVRPSEIFFGIFGFLGSSSWQFLTIFSFFEKNDFLGLPRPFFDHFSDM